MSRVTADIAQMVAQVPAIVEGLTGVDVAKMIQGIPGLRQDGRANGNNAQAPAEAALPVAPAARKRLQSRRAPAKAVERTAEEPSETSMTPAS